MRSVSGPFRSSSFASPFTRNLSSRGSVRIFLLLRGRSSAFLPHALVCSSSCTALEASSRLNRLRQGPIGGGGKRFGQRWIDDDGRSFGLGWSLEVVAMPTCRAATPLLRLLSRALEATTGSPPAARHRARRGATLSAASSTSTSTALHERRPHTPPSRPPRGRRLSRAIKVVVGVPAHPHPLHPPRISNAIVPRVASRSSLLLLLSRWSPLSSEAARATRWGLCILLMPACLLVPPLTHSGQRLSSCSASVAGDGWIRSGREQDFFFFVREGSRRSLSVV
jgi:hypothetical protein